MFHQINLVLHFQVWYFVEVLFVAHPEYADLQVCDSVDMWF